MTDSVFLREIREALRSLPKVLVWMVAEYVNDYNEEQKRKSVRGIDLFARHVRRHPTIRLGVCHGDQGIRITARAVWWPETAKLRGSRAYLAPRQMVSTTKRNIIALVSVNSTKT